MKIADFELERYFAKWEFAVRHLLCASDLEGFPMADLLALADDVRSSNIDTPANDKLVARLGRARASMEEASVVNH